MVYQVVTGDGSETKIFYVEADDQKEAFNHVYDQHKPQRNTLKIRVVCLAEKIEKAEEKNKQEAE